MENTAQKADEPADRSASRRPFRQIHAHIPLPYLRKKLDLFLEGPLNPEIYFNIRSLERIGEAEISALAETLRSRERRVTIHGPFYDLSPGAVDPGFRALTVERMRLALEKARVFAPDAVVFHPGYDPLRFAEYKDVWRRNSLRSWKQLLPLAEGMPGTWLLIENIFERDPFTLAELLKDLPSPPFGFCFDVGHFLVFSDHPLDLWLETLGPWLREVHLHDNGGQGDEHLPPGKGIFNFPNLFRELSKLPQDIIGTVEAHSEPHLLEGIAYLETQGVLP